MVWCVMWWTNWPFIECTKKVMFVRKLVQPFSHLNVNVIVGCIINMLKMLHAYYAIFSFSHLKLAYWCWSYWGMGYRSCEVLTYLICCCSFFERNLLQVLVVIMNVLLVVNELLLPLMLIWHNMTSSHPTTITIGGTYGECKVLEPLD